MILWQLNGFALHLRYTSVRNTSIKLQIHSLSEDTFRENYFQTYARCVKVHINVQLFVDKHQMFKRLCGCLRFVYIEALEFMLFNVNLLITNLW